MNGSPAQGGAAVGDVDGLRRDLVQAIEAAADGPALETVRVSAFGKKGQLSALMRRVGTLPPQERRTLGRAVNALKDEVVARLRAREAALTRAALDARLARECLDVTLPARPLAAGKLHPVGQALEELVVIFARMGFSVADGPDVEDDFHNFTALNFPPDHPARDMHDTFFLQGDKNGKRHLLRTHTSPGQIRVLKTHRPPLRIVIPGRVYRCDSDSTHAPMFHQIEGLAIDDASHMASLKGCLSEALESYFGCTDLPLRFRPSFFPFTEPSFEVDIAVSRDVAGGSIGVGGGSDWLEVVGGGMVHPNVLRTCGLDPEEHRGFAFGIGLERLAMLKYGIPDLRAFFDSDVRWLRRYGLSSYDAPSFAWKS